MRIRGRRNSGFSLTEVLLAVGVLSVGMIFVAGVFPVAIHFTTIATERTVAAVAADEAFAKIRLYGVNLLNPALRIDELEPFEDVALVPPMPAEYAYPSTNTDLGLKQYFWSALCRLVGPSDVQVTVFVSRRIGSGPVPVLTRVVVAAFSNRALRIQNPNDKTLINDGYTIVNNETGQIYRVLERERANDTIVQLDLDMDWGPGNLPPVNVWVVPPAGGGGRYPCVAVYQKVIRF